MRALMVCLILWPWGAQAGEFFTLKGHGGPIMDIAVAPHGQIATASFDNSVGLWSGKTPQWLDGHEAAVNVVIPTSTGWISAGDDFSIRSWPSGDVIGQHKGKVVELAEQDGLVASASWDGSIGIWQDGQLRYMLAGHEAGVNAVQISADGKTLYSASTDGTIRVWDLETGQERQQLVRHGFGINELVLNETMGWLAYGAVDGATRIIDLNTGADIADFTLNRRPILALALSPDQNLLAVGDGEGYIMIVDTGTWKIARDFRATLRGPVWALAFSRDGENIHAGGLEDAMYSWPINTLTEHGTMADTQQSFLKDPDEMENGERQFARKCSICHSLDPGSNRKAGPTLHGVFGRRAGAVSDYSYSETLDGSDIIWDDETINALFDLGPDHYIPGTKMPMQRITRPEDRADLIAFLRRATQTGDAE
ncbi:MAG: c-type cytochrome [Rhodobacteraceae bacterium]|nr:c-type cytochrome [Paracoccaceae bacterium]